MKRLFALLLLILASCQKLDRLTQGREAPGALNTQPVGDVLTDSPPAPPPDINELFAEYVWKEMGWTPHTLSDSEIRQVAVRVVGILQYSGSQRIAWHEVWHSTAPAYLDAFMNYPDANSYGAFCQKTALSVSEVLIRLGVSSRQIHMYNPATGTGDHQFLQYKHPVTGEWAVIDPYFGVYYEKDGHLMGRDEMEAYVQAGGAASALARVYDPSRGGAGAGEVLDEYWSTRQIQGGLGYLTLAQDERRRFLDH